jgi:THAP4-like, heme-binding beta-barrel domain
MRVVTLRPLHPDVGRLAMLLGTWVGEGTGSYPTTSDFAYREETVVSHDGKPRLSYRQCTWALDDGRPLHSETGFWRPAPSGRVELVLAHGSGVVEVSEGTVDGGRLELSSTAVHCTTTAKEVSALRRVVEVEGDRLRYQLDMAAVGQPRSPHLTAALTRLAH